MGNVQVESYGGWMDDGTCSSLTLQGRATFNINGGNDSEALYIEPCGGQCGLDWHAYRRRGPCCGVRQYSGGRPFRGTLCQNQMLYLSFDKANETVTGFADGNLSFPEDFSITAPSEWEDQAQMEVTILPGATVTVPWMFYKGTLLVEGEVSGQRRRQTCCLRHHPLLRHQRRRRDGKRGVRHRGHCPGRGDLRPAGRPGDPDPQGEWRGALGGGARFPDGAEQQVLYARRGGGHQGVQAAPGGYAEAGNRQQGRKPHRPDGWGRITPSPTPSSVLQDHTAHSVPSGTAPR